MVNVVVKLQFDIAVTELYVHKMQVVSMIMVPVEFVLINPAPQPVIVRPVKAVKLDVVP